MTTLITGNTYPVREQLKALGWGRGTGRPRSEESMRPEPMRVNRWKPITLSRTQAKAMDRVGGAELTLPWPDGLPPGPPLAADGERPTTREEHAAAEKIVLPACRPLKLVPVRSIVRMLRRPPDFPRGGQVEQHLCVVIIGHRWVHATRAPAPAICWYPVERIEAMP